MAVNPFRVARTRGSGRRLSRGGSDRRLGRGERDGLAGRRERREREREERLDVRCTRDIIENFGSARGR